MNSPSGSEVIKVGTGHPHPLCLDLKGVVALVGGGVSERTWLRRVKAGEAPAPIKLGRRTLWRVSDVTAYVAGLPTVQQ